MGCYQATQSDIQWETVVQPRTNVANGVYIGTSSAGAPADRGFHLAVFC